MERGSSLHILAKRGLSLHFLPVVLFSYMLFSPIFLACVIPGEPFEVWWRRKPLVIFVCIGILDF